MKWLISRGIDFITTNEPVELQEYCNKGSSNIHIEANTTTASFCKQ